MSILVTGANGFVGNRLCKELIKAGFKVIAVLRPGAFFDVAGCNVLTISDLNAAVEWKHVFSDVNCVIHLAARVHVMNDDAVDPMAEFRYVNVRGTELIARYAAASGVKRFVYVSSIKVNGEITCGLRKFSENDIAEPQDSYRVSKMEAEQVLKNISNETGMEVTILRPPLVYGEGVKGNFAEMMKVLAKRIPLPFAVTDNARSLIYVGNLVQALMICAKHPLAGGQTYLVSDGVDVSTPELLSQLGNAMSCPARLFSCPTKLLRLVAKFIGNERLVGSLRIDSGKLRRDIGWQPVFSLQEGLQRTDVSAKSYLN